MLDARELHTFYGESHALQGVSLAVEAGETVCLLGRNGAGKTTTLSSLVGIVPPRSGSVRFDGREIAGQPAHRSTRQGLCLVPEDRRIFPDLTVTENLEVSRYRGNERAHTWTVEGVFETFSMLAEIRHQAGKTLSGGQQQMLAIARALVGQPRMLLLDEPSEGLAPVIVHQIGALLDELAGTTTILFTDQNLPFAFRHASRCYVLEKGHVVFAGTTAELEASPELQDRYLSVA